MTIKSFLNSAARHFWQQLSQTEASPQSAPTTSGAVPVPAATKRAPVAIFIAGLVTLLIGLALVYAARHDNAGSPIGWMFIAIGIFGVLGAIGLFSGADR